MTLRTVGLLVLFLVFLLPSTVSASRALTLDERVAAQRAIEEVYWRHRIWPAENSTPKPSFDSIMPTAAVRARVEGYLAKSNELESCWRRAITGDQLQAELDRMARGSRDPRVLQELFDVLGNDPFVIAETLARQSLAERLVRNWYATDARFQGAAKPQSFDAWWNAERAKLSVSVPAVAAGYKLPTLESAACSTDTWRPTFSEVPDGRKWPSTIWTGTEMIVWGGETIYKDSMTTGGRYNPATDTWTPTSIGAGVPDARSEHSAVWTGTEMIIWGGRQFDHNARAHRYLGSGGRYDPVSDSWTPTSMGTNLPQARYAHTAVWSGSAMIVWGGGEISHFLNSGGRYDPSSDTWLPTSVGANVPSGRRNHLAFWTGTEMLVWGGGLNTGGRYNPSTDGWTATSIVNVPPSSYGPAVWTGTEMILWTGSDSGGARYAVASDNWAPITSGLSGAPSPRSGHSVVWTGSKMIVWGGTNPQPVASGAAYDPANNTWTPIAPMLHPTGGWQTTVWTGTEMIVWGGLINGDYLISSGVRYNPTTDSWLTTSTGSTVPSARVDHSALWTGAEMIVWGGDTGWSYSSAPYQEFNSGGRYDPATDTWMPMSVTGAPSPRDSHSAVWTGREMIVWGGGYAADRSGTDSQLFNSGARYDPVTDHWTPTSTAGGVPSPRAVHAAVWTGGKMLISGGCCSVTDNGRYDPVTDHWSSMAPGTGVPGAEGVHTAFWTGTELLTWGGGSAGARYDPSADSWAALPAGPGSPPPSFYDSTVWTGTEMIVWGGIPNTGGRFNPTTNIWTPTSTGSGVPSARSRQSAVWTGRELIVWGGAAGNTTYLAANNGARYKPSSDAWTSMSTITQLAQPTRGQSAIWTGTEMILWGGLPLTTTGARYCACPSGRLVYRDVDGDGFGDPGVSTASCDGSAPAGYVLDFTDCNDLSTSIHPGAAEACNDIDDNCNGLIDESASGEDVDGDLIHDVCDNCRVTFNATQSDFDHDGQGDACDLNDGLIYEWRDDKTSVSWQAEVGPTSWNVYVGDLAVLRSTGVYTQLPGANALATRQCGVGMTGAGEPGVPATGKASFSLVTGVSGGVEGSLGSATSGPRANTNPCP